MEKRIKGLIYRVVKVIANIALFFYFRGIERHGKDNIPSSGPFIYAVNHQNAFLDAIIVGALSPVPTYFMTRSDVFKPPFDWILDALKMMPIYRIRDGYNSLSKNDAIFHTCKNILEEKNALLIFPEGNHGLEYYLRPLTKGLARISLQSQEVMNLDLKIIPVGLNYFNHFNSGHKLTIAYHTPIEVSKYLSGYKDHKHTGLKTITEAVSKGMQQTLVLPENSESYQDQKNIFQRKNEKLSFDELLVKKQDKSYLTPENKHKLLGWIGELFSIFNLPPILLTKYIIQKKVSQKIFTGSIKIASLILLFPLWFGFTFSLCSFTIGLKWACIVLALQILSLVLRRELVRFSH